MIFNDDSRRTGAQSNLDYMLRRLHIDPVLLTLVFAVLMIGGFVLYSASGASGGFMYRQSVKIMLALGIMLVIAQISPGWMRRGSPWHISTRGPRASAALTDLLTRASSWRSRSDAAWHTHHAGMLDAIGSRAMTIGAD